VPALRRLPATRLSAAVSCGAAFLVVLIFAGCPSEPPRPRTLADINAERDSLPAVYLSQKSLNDVIAPGNATPPVIDKATGDLCWPAYMCTNPDCPAKDEGKKGRPFLFIHFDPFLTLKPDGTFEREELPPGADRNREIRARGAFPDPTCPACAKNRNFARESPQEAQKYLNWVKPYVLPESARRMKELDEEYQKRQAELLERRGREPPR
jgi:hypothetical protein